MALSANTVWEVRGATGSDTNGGGFVAGASGTDWSQQASPQYSVTDGVTAGTTTITSATASFGTDVVGNIMYVSGGTGSITAGWYQIASRTNSTTIVVDRSTGLTSGTGVTLHIGGALATISQMFTNMAVAGQGAFIKADGTYSISTGLNAPAIGSSTVKQRICGYTATRTDGGRVTIQATAAITMLTVGAGTTAFEFDNFMFDGNSATASNGIDGSSGNNLGLFNVTIKNVSGFGLASTQVSATDLEIFGCGTTAAWKTVSSSQIIALRVYLHDNTVAGLSSSGSGQLFICDSVFESNSGAGSDGVSLSVASSSLFKNCVFYNNGRDGLRATSGGVIGKMWVVQNCIFEANAGYGINQSSGGSTTLDMHSLANNAYYNNTTAARNGFAAEQGAVTLTGSPCTNAAGGDFSLNNTAGAGAACRAAGLPGALLGSATTGHLDIGAAQHADPAGSGVPATPNFSGGFEN